MASLLPLDAISCVSFEIDSAIEFQLSERQRQLKVIEEKICPLYLNGFCTKQSLCNSRHSKGVDGEVCKHWVRGLCKKGDDCEYLHQYDMTRMPECQFFSKTGECAKGDECPFLHIDQGVKITICAWYKRGFCRNGANCKNTHKRLELCPRYFTGFCPDGPDCLLTHPKFDLMINEDAQVQADLMAAQNAPGAHNVSSQPGQRVVLCFKCHQFGHLANVCPYGKNRFRDGNQQQTQSHNQNQDNRPSHNQNQNRPHHQQQSQHHQNRQRDRNYSNQH